MKRPALVIGSALLGLVGLWVAVLLPPTHPGGRRALLTVGGSPTATASTTSSAAARPAGSPVSAATGQPSVTASPRPQISSRAVPPARATGSPAGSTSKSTASPHPTATVAPYAFVPKANASGPAPTAELRFSDLSLHSGQQVLATFTMNTPGAIEFDAHTASSSSTSGSYPTSALLACVEFLGQSPCHPVATAQPAYWAVTATDLAQHTRYRLRVRATADSALLAGIHIGWRGPRSLQVEGFRLPGGCQASVGKGYAPGCGLKYKIVTSGPVLFTATTATAGLQISLKNTVTNAKAYSGPLNSPQHIQVPAAGEWSGHLYPSDGTAVADLTLTMDWH